MKRIVVVISFEDAVSPIKEIGVGVRKLLPASLPPISFHSLMDQEYVRPCDRLVIDIGFPVRASKAFQPIGKPDERIEHGIAAQIQPGHSDVIRVMKAFVGERTSLELLEELFIIHNQESIAVQNSRIYFRPPYLFLLRFTLLDTAKAFGSSLFSNSR